MVISHVFCIDSIRIFWHFQTDHGRKVNWSYSWIVCMIVLLFFPILVVVRFIFLCTMYSIMLILIYILQM